MEWERVLWKRQPFPDNCVGNSFFRIKKKSPEVDVSTALYGATSVSQEICSCLILVAVFYGLAEKALIFPALLLLLSISTFSLYIIMQTTMWLMNHKDAYHITVNMFGDLKVASFTCMLLWFLSPIIQTLTASVSTDTVMACTTALLFFRLLIHPYGAQVAIENPIMSCNLGIFASICLASRLNKHEDVFTLIMTAVALFALFPSFRKFCKVEYPMAYDLSITLIMIILTSVALSVYAYHLVGLLTMSIIVCNLLVPLLFIYMQPYRQNIYGPWDEAQIKDS